MAWRELHLIIAATMLHGCSGSRPSLEEVSSPTAAEFRFHARSLAGDLYNPSCDAPPGFSRSLLLHREFKSVDELKKRLQGTPAKLHLGLALEDAAYAAKADGSCWNDDDLALAKLHVDMTKQSVRGGISLLMPLAEKINSGSSRLGIPQSNAAQLRYLVRHLIVATRPMCELTTQASNDVVMKAARSEVETLKRRLRNTDLALPFAVAESDALYEQSLTQVECQAPSSEAATKFSTDALADTKKRVSDILKISST